MQNSRGPSSHILLMLSFLCLLWGMLLPACKGKEEPQKGVFQERDLKISDFERVRGSYTPPQEGKVTEKLLQEYLELMERTREIVIAQGGEIYLDPRFVGKNKRRKNERKRRIRKALEWAQLEEGIVFEKYKWLDENIRPMLDKGHESKKEPSPLLDRLERAMSGMGPPLYR